MGWFKNDDGLRLDVLNKYSYKKVSALWIPSHPFKSRAKCFMFGIGEVGAAYIIINGVSAREERKTIVLTGVK